MSAVAADVKFETRELREVLGAMRDRGKNLGDAMKFIAHDMVDRVEDNFDSEGASSPVGKWKGLAQATLDRRRKKGRGAKILQDTGKMATQTTADWGNDYAEAFNNAEQAKYHVSKKPRRKIPLRDFLSMDLHAVERDAADALTAQIVGG